MTSLSSSPSLPTLQPTTFSTSAPTTTTATVAGFDAALVGGAAGGGGALLILGGVVACLVCRVRRRRKKQPDDDVALKSSQGSDNPTGYIYLPALLNKPTATAYGGVPTALDDTEYLPAAPALALKRPKSVTSDLGVIEDMAYIAARPAGDLGRPSRNSEFTSARAETWAIEVGDLELGSVIGQGAFGVVRRAEWRGRTVAVKQIKKSTIGDDKAVADFEEEIGRMAALPMHENVVRLFGVVQLANGDVGAVVEFCAQGALVDALYGEKARELSPTDLLQIAYDAACGVMHLHANKIVHRDIAARNVLLAGKKDLLAKVSDFGMARNIESVYSGVASEQHTAATIGPVKWMAPEQLERMAYSRASDVFAFGVLLYEIFARSTPWAGVANVNVITQVLRGNRMELSRVPTELRDTVQRCWAQEPRDRPTMQQVVLALKM
jgi:hypothetical protein